jgi:hypothetical protein
VAVSDAKKVSTWYALLKSLAVFNVALWAVTCIPLAWAAQNATLEAQILLSGLYVAVCGFRSWLPRVDLERYCMVDSPLSSMFVGRTAATIAEVCFAAQVALCLHQVGKLAGLEWVMMASYAVVPLLALAQCFCWYSVATLNHLGHAIEQSLWTSTMLGVGVCLVASSSRLTGNTQLFVLAGAVLSFGFVIFMTLVDVPMYIRRWQEGRRERRAYLGIAEGLRDAHQRRITTTEWAKWRPEVAWLTSYFSICVWLSVALVHFTA